MKQVKRNAEGIPIPPVCYASKADRIAVQESEAEIIAAYQKMAADNFLVFVRGIRIEAGGRPKVFENCMAPFQRDCFEDLAPSLHALRKGKKPSDRRFWFERTKKASKDADIAIALLWLIAFPLRPFYAQIGAVDKGQAAIIKERMLHLLEHNKWLNDLVEIVQWEVRSKQQMASGAPMAKVEIMAADIGGSHGGTPDLLVLNELTHVSKWEFVENLFDNADGVPHGVVIVATNAGFVGTIAESWKVNAIGSDHWVVNCLAQPAPWHDEVTLADARKRCKIQSRYDRLWCGVWVSGKGDALDDKKVQAVFCLDGPTDGPQPGWVYLLGLDLGITHDHSGLVAVGVNPAEQIIRVADWIAWEPPKGGEINLMDVEETCQVWAERWRARLYYDPHQAKLMAQRLERAGVAATEMTFSSSTNLTAMASALIQVIKDGILEAFDDPEQRLLRDLGKFNIVERAGGLKLESVSDAEGHADVGTALVIVLPAAVELLRAGISYLQPDDPVAYVGDPDGLSDDEVADMPDEFKDLFEVQDEAADLHRQGHSRADDPFAGFE